MKKMLIFLTILVFAVSAFADAVLLRESGIAHGSQAPTDDEWIGWDDGTNGNSIGLTAGGEFYVASRWDPAALAPYDGYELTKIIFFPASDVPTTYELMIWTGVNASTLVLTQPVTTFVFNDFNEVILDTPVIIDASDELWFGYATNHAAGEHPAGTDPGPAVAGYGDMITMDGGVTWDPLSGLGLDYNWNLQGYVEEPILELEVPTNVSVDPDLGLLTWEAPAGGGQLYELIQHDGNPLNAYYQSFDNGYGVVYDVSGYTDVTLEMLDFRHSAWGVFGIWDYALHIVDWDTYTEVAVVTGLQTTGDDIWEEEIDLGSVSETGLIGVFMEPMGNTAADAYPCIDSDDVGPDGLSYYGPLSNYAGMSLSGIGDFLMDLWIMAEEVDGIVKAKRFEANFGSGVSRVESTIPDMDFITLNQTSCLRDLTGYNVYLDDMGTVLANVGIDVFEYLYFDLVNGEDYIAGVSAIYDEGESDIVEFPFTYTGTGTDNIVNITTALKGNYPNPFNPVTNIAFSLSEPGHVTLEVYNIKGEKVRTLVDEVRSATNHIVTWNGMDDNNKSVASGVYFYKMISEGNSGDYISTKKMILLK